jgi:hypothetical protein
MREISGGLVIIAGGIVFSASMLAHSLVPAIRQTVAFDSLPYIGFLVAGVLGLFGAILILSAPSPGSGSGGTAKSRERQP